MKPPTFFLSSTIYDFRDLRSAIKFYLEEQGCRVLASEFNDFLKPLDRHSYDACLHAIEQADFFVLLIGTRVGGWFIPEERVSITQQEYRQAYELQKAGKLKIVTFVRDEVWQVREERKELASYLGSLPYGESERTKIKAYPSKFAEDADFISGFITEVARNRETAKALKAGGALPSGNWIHVFHNFGDVISTLQSQVFSGLPIEEAAMRRLLQSEIREILRRCIPKTPRGLLSVRRGLENFLTKYPLTTENRKDEFLEIDASDWDKFAWFAFHVISRKFHPIILDRAIVSPFFLQFDPILKAFEETPIHNALLNLREEIRRFNEANTPETLTVIYEHTPRQRGFRNGSIEVEPIKLATLLHLLDRWVNLIELSTSIHRYLDGGGFVEPSLRPRTPILGMEEKIEEEFPSIDEILSVIGSNDRV
ncbi:MAG TPA: DUF4062 domain-containing protein [Acidobacteriaceae bacterium]|nr:DUF4062 domain-containing protein [Acidobacteriaceae bacterium]